MAEYAISGVWKSKDIITDYAIHPIKNRKVELAEKYTKKQAVNLLSKAGNSARTAIWNYSTKKWNWGTDVEVVDDAPEKYLRTTQDKTLIDNLAHLINYGLVTEDFE